MSKASEWINGRPICKVADDLVATVTLYGFLRLEQGRADIECKPESALALGHWIIDTFGEPDA